MAILLPLEEDQARYMKDILEYWLEEYDEAHAEIISAPGPCFDSTEHFIETVNRSRYHREEAEAIKAKLEMELGLNG